MSRKGLGYLTVFMELNSSRFNKGIDQSMGKLEKFRKKVNNMGSRIGVPLTAAAGGFLTAATQIETGMIGVQKTTGLADAEVEKLKQSLLDISARSNVAIGSLLETAKVAGQMGIEGSKAISKFAETFAKLEAASDRTVQGELGAQSFAKFIDLSRETVDSAENVASALVHLGNTSKTTEGAILSIALEIAKKTNRFELGAANILGLATTLDELGVQAEVSGSTMQKFYENLNKALITGLPKDGIETFVELIGASREEMQRMLESDPTELLLRFSAGLKEASDNGQNTAAMLKDVDLSGIRAMSTMNVLASNVDKLNDKVFVSNKAYQENLALQKEADAANRGLAAAWTNLTNSLSILADQLFAQSGGLTAIAAAVRELAEVSRTAIPAAQEILFNFMVAVDNFGNSFNTMVYTAIDDAKTFANNVVESFTWLKDEVLSLVGQIIDGVKEYFGQKLAETKETVKGYVEDVAGAFKWLWDDLVGHSTVPDIVEGIEYWFGKLDDVMVQPVNEATDAVAAAFDSLDNSVAGALTDMALNFTDWASFVQEGLGLIAVQTGNPNYAHAANGVGSAWGAYNSYKQAENSSGSDRVMGYMAAGLQAYQAYGQLSTAFSTSVTTGAGMSTGMTATQLAAAQQSTVPLSAFGGAGAPVGTATTTTGGGSAAVSGGGGMSGAAAGAGIMIALAALSSWSNSNQAKMQQHYQSMFDNERFNNGSTNGINFRTNVDPSRDGLTYFTGGRNTANVLSAAGGQLGGMNRVAIDEYGNYFQTLINGTEGALEALKKYTPEIQAFQQMEAEAADAALVRTMKRDEAESASVALRREQAVEFQNSQLVMANAADAATAAVVSSYGQMGTTVEGVAQAMADGFLSASEISANNLNLAGEHMVASLNAVRDSAAAAAAMTASITLGSAGRDGNNATVVSGGGSGGRTRGSFSSGGISRGPDSGYPVTLHGTEGILPFDNGDTATIPVIFNGLEPLIYEVKGMRSDIKQLKHGSMGRRRAN